MAEPAGEIFSIGHSTHDLPTFTGLLRRHGIGHVADVRSFPRSRRLPHFNAESLGRSLAAEGIGYTHLPALGGLRKPVAGSPNDGWQHPGFRGYADHMGTEGFAAGLRTLEDLALMRRTVSPRVQVKAAGGVRTLDALLEVLELGVTRVGATATAAMLDDFRARKAAAA